MSVPRLPRLPAAPLKRRAAERGVSHAVWAENAHTTVVSLRQRLNDPRGIVWHTADRYAVALGEHPALLWGKRWSDVQTAAERYRRSYRAFAQLRHAEQLRREEAAGWEELERSWRRWRDQRSRLELEAWDRCSEGLELVAAQ